MKIFILAFSLVILIICFTLVFNSKCNSSAEMELEYLINERLLTSENDLKMEFRTHTFRASEFLYLVKNQTESYSSIKKKVDKDTTNRVDKTVDQEDFTSIYVQAHHGIVPKVESYTWVPCKTANIIIYISEHGDAWIHIRRY